MGVSGLVPSISRCAFLDMTYWEMNVTSLVVCKKKHNKLLPILKWLRRQQKASSVSPNVYLILKLKVTFICSVLLQLWVARLWCGLSLQYPWHGEGHAVCRVWRQGCSALSCRTWWVTKITCTRCIPYMGIRLELQIEFSNFSTMKQGSEFGNSQL